MLAEEHRVGKSNASWLRGHGAAKGFQRLPGIDHMFGIRLGEWISGIAYEALLPDHFQALVFSELAIAADKWNAFC